MHTHLHFLVVNDDDVMRRIFVTLLRDCGYQKVSIAVDGEMALRTLKAAREIGAPIDFLITDDEMPLMDGRTLVHRIRDLGDTMPILMATRKATEDDIRAAASAGVDGYYVQPFKTVSFKKKIESMLVKKGLKDPVLEIGVLPG